MDSMGSAGVSLVPGGLVSPQAALQALCSAPKTMQRSSLQNWLGSQHLVDVDQSAVRAFVRLLVTPGSHKDT